MKKINQFFQQVNASFRVLDYVISGLLIFLTVWSIIEGSWLYVACNLLWLLSYLPYVYYSGILVERLKRAKKLNDELRGLLAAYDDLMSELEPTAETGQKQPVTRTTNISEAYKGIADSFSRAELKDYLEKQGIKSTVRKVIYKWKGKGLIKEVAKNIYIKTDISAG
jgi:hypothetical protein